MRAGGISIWPARICGRRLRRSAAMGRSGSAGACGVRSRHRLGAARCRCRTGLALSRRRDRHAGLALGRACDCKSAHVRGRLLSRPIPSDPLRADAERTGDVHRRRSRARFSGQREQSADGSRRPRGADREARQERTRQSNGVCARGSRAAGRIVRSPRIRMRAAGRCRRRRSCAVCCIIMGSIWPGRIALDGVSLGDTWRHPAIKRSDETNGPDAVSQAVAMDELFAGRAAAGWRRRP